MKTKIAFVDCETTGLESYRHDIWELAIILREQGEEPIEKSWFVTPDLSSADPSALRMNRFYERWDPAGIDDLAVAHETARMLDGAWLIAANPAFDAGFIDKFLRVWNQAPAWHYRLVCVENLAAGRLGVRPPWDPKDLSDKLGVERPENEHHTALGDTRWAMRLYDAVYEAPQPRGKAAATTAAGQPPKGAKDSETTAEADPPVEAPPSPTATATAPGLPRRQRPSETEPTPCEGCKTPVPVEQAKLSYSRYRKVLCGGTDVADGGCYERMRTAS